MRRPLPFALLLALPLLALGQDAKQERLELVREAKCASLFSEEISYNASGVIHKDGKLYVVFDGHCKVGVVDLSLEKPGSLINVDEAASSISDYEGVAQDAKTGHLFVVREAIRSNGAFHPEVIEFDADLEPLGRWLLDPVEVPSKGAEGLAFLRRGEDEFLLALLEGNHGAGGVRGKDKGNGRVRVYQRAKDGWTLKATLALPKTAAFKDYAGIDLRGDRLVVISQATSRVWIGTLDAENWTTDAGRVYKLPKGTQDAKYDTTEGVAWVTDDTLVVTSDEAKFDKPEGKAKAQSIHVFKIPAN